MPDQVSDIHPRIAAPPFTPILLASLALQPIPVKLFTPIAAHILKKIEQQYPDIFDRLKPLGRCQFNIVPTDFHCHFHVSLDNGAAQILVLPKNRSIDQPAGTVTATISGPLLSLIKLLEGRVDGDALFFSRELMIDGDTEAVLTLRNAVDSADISLERVLINTPWRLQPIAQKAVSGLSALFQRAQDDLALVHKSLLAPLTRQISLQDTDLDKHEEQIRQLQTEIRKLKAATKRNTTVTNTAVTNTAVTNTAAKGIA